MPRRLVVTPIKDIAALGPLAARAILLARDENDENKQKDRPDPEKGLIHPQEINNNAMFALFGILGAAIVIGAVWFFFWSKNGGFYFKEDDWDDYKSTVLRRKGPNGTIYSNATPSTILGGGSVYKDYDGMRQEMDDSTIVSGTTGITGITGGVSDIYGREKRRKKREQKEREKERRREEKAREKEEKKRSKRKAGVDGIMVDEEAEAQAMDELRNYRSEKAARVGGINVASEASEWDGSTNPSWSGVGTSTVDSGSTVTEGLMQHQEKRERSPSKKERDEERAARKEAERRERREQRERDRELGRDRNPEKSRERGSGEKDKKTGGIRKVYSTADKNASREAERLRAEARRVRAQEREAAAAKQREREQRSSKRDFSWQHGGDDESAIALRRIDERGESLLDDVHEHEEGVIATGSGGNGKYAKLNNNDYDEIDEVPPLRTSRALVPSSYTSTESDLMTESEVSGHKVYKHPVHIPVSGAESSVGSEVSYAEERRKKRNGAGYRRHHRRDGDGDSSVGGY